MNKIQILPKELINLIAAGEVIERPASVLKELLENSIDAQSTNIIVNITDYGKGTIELVDNGIGMNKEDALLAFEQHATSKIKSETDLENIVTLGFRGEALASISSVADSIQLDTKTDSDEAVNINIKNKEHILNISTKSDRGTKIRIDNIFANVPARKKFLKSDSTELKYIVGTFLEIALINLNIYFELNHNGKNLYTLTKASKLKDRIFEIWGSNTAEEFYDIRQVETNICNIELLLCKPESARKNTNLQYIYVNSRKIDSKVIGVAIKEAYQGFIHKDLKPSYIVLIHISPAQVDVNVHPRKLEVRFENSQEIFRTLFSAVRKTLEINTKADLSERINIGNDFPENDITYKSSPIPGRLPSFLKDTTITTHKDSYNLRPRNNLVNDAISFSKALIENVNEEKSESRIEEIKNIRQLFNTYITFERDDNLIIIDQHAAAEKILFEKLLYNISDIKTKPLLVPEIIEFKSHEKEAILKNKDGLTKIGLIIDDFGGNSIQITEIPEYIEKIDYLGYFAEIINNKEDFSWLNKEYKDMEVSHELYDLLALTACHGSIRAGQYLDQQEMINIINNLQKLKQPNNCPHGRPTTWKITKQAIEKNFKRII